MPSAPATKPISPLPISGSAYPSDSKPARPAPRGKWAVRNIDAFYTGQHRPDGADYTDDDLKDMADNARLNADTFKPPVVIGHSEDQQALLADTGVPKWGDIENVRTDGERLKLDGVGLPEQLAKWIEDGNYDSVSIEVYPQPPQGLKGKGKMIRRVAILGGYPPELKKLAKLPKPQWESHGELTARATRLKSSVRRMDNGHYEFFSEVVMPEATKTPEPDADSKPAVGGDPRETLTKEHGWDPDIVHGMPDEHVQHACEKMAEAKSQKGSLPDIPNELGENEAMQRYSDMMDSYAEQCKAKFGEKCNGMKGKHWQFAEAPPVSTTTAEPKKDADKFAEQVSAEVKKITDPILAQVQQVLGEVKATSNAAVKTVSDLHATNRKQEIDAFCEQMLKEGYIAPKELDATGGRPTLKDDLYKADAVTPIHTYGEAGKEIKLTAYDRLKQQIQSRVKINRSQQITPSGTDPDEEVLKVEQFAEQPAVMHALATTDRTPAQYVADFKALRKKNPAFTAAQYGVKV